MTNERKYSLDFSCFNSRTSDVYKCRLLILFINLTGMNKTEHLQYEMTWFNECLQKKYQFYIFYEVNKFSIFLICIPFLLVLGYLLVECFSLTQSSTDGVEVDRCSLMTYLGHVDFILSSQHFKGHVYQCAKLAHKFG